MGFSHVEVARGRATRPFEGVSAAIKPVGSPANRVPTVKLYIGADVLRQCGLRIGERVNILIGNGEDAEKIRIARSDVGDVRIRTETQQNVGFICSRLIPRGNNEDLSKRDIPFTIIGSGVLELTLPWLAFPMDLEVD